MYKTDDVEFKAICEMYNRNVCEKKRWYTREVLESGVKELTKDARDYLLECNMPRICDIVNNKDQDVFTKTELLNEAVLSAIENIEQYFIKFRGGEDLSSDRFWTYVSQRVSRHLNYIIQQKEMSNKRDEYYVDVLGTYDDLEEVGGLEYDDSFGSDVSFDELLKDMKSHLTDKEFKAVTGIILNDKLQSDLAEEWDVSRSRVYQIYHKGIRKARNVGIRFDGHLS